MKLCLVYVHIFPQETKSYPICYIQVHSRNIGLLVLLRKLLLWIVQTIFRYYKHANIAHFNLVVDRWVLCEKCETYVPSEISLKRHQVALRLTRILRTSSNDVTHFRPVVFNPWDNVRSAAIYHVYWPLRHTWASKGAAKYWYSWPRVPLGKKSLRAFCLTPFSHPLNVSYFWLSDYIASNQVTIY